MRSSEKEDQIQKKTPSPQDLLKKLMSHDSNESGEFDNVVRKLDSLLEQLDIVKNSTTVSLGDYQALTRIYTGQSMYVDTRDISVAPHLMQHGVWEKQLSRLIRNLLKPGQTFFDIGANFGYFALLAGLEVKANSKQIHIFEANPELTELIKKSLSINGFTSHAVLNNVAVSDKKGTLTLSRMADLWGSSTVRKEKDIKDYKTTKDTFDKQYKVPAITIDDYVKEHKITQVDLMKIDVEGVEDSVYRGMKKTIKANPNVKILLEFTKHAYDDPKKFLDEIMSDFEFVYSMTEDHNRLSPVENYSSLEEGGNENHEFIMLLLSNEKLYEQF